MRFSLQSLVLVVVGALSLLVVYVRIQSTIPQDESRAETWLKRIHPQPQSQPIPETSACSKAHHHVAFIKVHKAGSSTIANIMFRFGIARHLTFLMPAKDVTISLHLSQPWKNILPLPEGATHYDMLSNHAVYERSEIKRLFPEDTAIIAVIRKPMGHLESSMYYYYPRRYPDQEDKVGAYLKSPELLGASDRYVNNSMAYELGVPRMQFFNESFVRSQAERLTKEIDFMLILEKLDESLVLLKRRLCWQLADILYIIRNVNKRKPKVKRTDEEIAKLKRMMPAHFILYDYFYKKLEDEISVAPGLQEEVSHFKGLLQLLSDFCQTETESMELEVPPSEWNEQFRIPRADCQILQFDGLQILHYARVYQYGKDWREFVPS